MLNISIMRGSKGPFRLKMMSKGIFQIHSKSSSFEGTKKIIFEKAVELGCIRKELDLAVEEMNKMGHDCAEFGIGGSFMYTINGAKNRVA